MIFAVKLALVYLGKESLLDTDPISQMQLQVGKVQGDVGWVTFCATLMQAGRDVSFTEKSRFERVNGRWPYHSAN